MPLKNCFVQNALDWSCWPLEKKAWKEIQEGSDTAADYSTGLHKWCVCVYWWCQVNLLCLLLVFPFLRNAIWLSHIVVTVAICHTKYAICHILNSHPSASLSNPLHMHTGHRSWNDLLLICLHEDTVSPEEACSTISVGTPVRKKHMGKCNRLDLQTSVCQDLPPRLPKLKWEARQLWKL